jgi:hypothetical protein
VTKDQCLAAEFEQSGRVWLRDAVSVADLLLLDNTVSLETRPGQRVEFDDQAVVAFSVSSTVVQVVRRIDPQAKPARVVGFNKSQNENWTKKAGIWHCEPTMNSLERMLFVRVHLDDTDRFNGAMRIARGSHDAGFVRAAEAADMARNYPEEVCKAKRGDILILKMLTLDGSKPSQMVSNRRAIRIDFASFDLPAPLRWK